MSNKQYAKLCAEIKALDYAATQTASRAFIELLAKKRAQLAAAPSR